MFMILAFFNHSLANEEKNLVPKSALKRYRFDRNYGIVVAPIFLISAVPVFGTITVLQIAPGNVTVNLPLRVFIWVGALVFGMGRRLLPSKWTTGTSFLP
jgi:hypothetical protein